MGIETIDKIEAPEVGSPVLFMDAYGKHHVALVTTVFVGGFTGRPSCNLVYVTDDESATDPYGRQVERKTSVPHESGQPAPGMKWRHL